MLYAKRKVRVRGYRSIVGHNSRREPLTPTLSPQARGEGEERAYARSDTSPSGNPNSNVFSVIDTIV
jgi:hypothetical protein